MGTAVLPETRERQAEPLQGRPAGTDNEYVGMERPRMNTTTMESGTLDVSLRNRLAVVCLVLGIIASLIGTRSLSLSDVLSTFMTF